MTAVPSLLLFKKVVNWGLTPQAINFAQSAFMGHRVCFSVPVDLMNEYFTWKRASGEVRPTGRFVNAPTTLANLPTFATAIERCLGTQYTDLDGVAEGLDYSSSALNCVDDMKRDPAVANATWNYSALPAAAAVSAPAATHYGANDLVMAFVLNKCFGSSAFDAYDVVYNLDDGFGMLTSEQLAGAIDLSMQEEEDLAAACVLPAKALAEQLPGDNKGQVDAMFRSLLSIDPQRFYKDGRQITGLFETNLDADASGNWCLAVGDKIEVPIKLFFRAPVTVLSVVDGAKNGSSSTPDEVETVFIRGEAATLDAHDRAQAAAADRSNVMAIRLQIVCAAPAIGPSTRSTSELASSNLAVVNKSSLLFYNGSHYPVQDALAVAVSGGVAPYSYSFTAAGTINQSVAGAPLNAPPGVTLSSAGLFSFDPAGVYAVAGRWKANVTITDSASNSVSTDIYVTVNGNNSTLPPPPPPPPTGMQSVSGLKLWLDSADPLATGTAPSDGATVSTWADKSGQGNNAIASGSPTYSAAGIAFDGSTTYYTAPYTSGTSVESLFIVVNYNLPGGLLMGPVGLYGRQLSADPTLVIANANVGFLLQGGTTQPFNTKTLWNYTMDSTATISYLNGNQDVVAGPASFSGTSGTLIGANTDGTSIFGGTISEVLIFNTSLSAHERQYVEGSLAWKWGLQAQLPAGHPYLSQAPPSSLPPPPPPPPAPLRVLLNASSYSGTGAWNDESGLGNNAVIEDGTAAKNTDGNGIVLDGQTSWTFPNVAVANAWTASVWYKSTGTPTGVRPCILTQIQAETVMNCQIGWLNSNGGPYSVGFNASNVGTVFDLTLGEWVNIQGTWDGTNLATYINGALIGTTQPEGAASDSGLGFRIGRRWDGTDYMVGEIGEVRIYNYAQTQAEVTAAYNASAATFAP
jgi:hypothetical protein